MTILPLTILINSTPQKSCADLEISSTNERKYDDGCSIEEEDGEE